MMRSTRPRLLNLFQGKGEAPDLDGVVRPRGKIYTLGLAMVGACLLSTLWPGNNRNSADTNTLPLTNPNAPKIPNNHMIVKAGRIPTQEEEEAAREAPKPGAKVSTTPLILAPRREEGIGGRYGQTELIGRRHMAKRPQAEVEDTTSTYRVAAAAAGGIAVAGVVAAKVLMGSEE
eukprot:Rhum_TRINITY_DN23297_c0_g1::Rhum_TRINITY_DN23297_c0_g1_i1::g.177626::m.177626